MTTKVEVIEIKPISPVTIKVHIVGDSDLVLNKMNDVTVRTLMDQRKDKAASKEKPNEWEEIITSIHWRDGKPEEFTEESYKDALINNAPCITAFGLKKSFGQAVTRGKLERYSTDFDANVNIVANGGLVPIKFAEAYIDEKLMTPQKGKPVLARLNRFTGWSADIVIRFVDTVYSAEQIVDIVNRAGFGIGIGSGMRTCGNGRYHVEGVEVVG